VYLNATHIKKIKSSLHLPGSKSESNRALILSQFFPSLNIHNLSTADDTVVLQKALQQKTGTVNVGHAGTAMRFLTAYYATQQKTQILLTGSERMQQRPIGILVNALRSMGADITYLAKEGYPPISVKGNKLTQNSVSLQAGISSQYISAIALIAPIFENLIINLQGKITSQPYLEMTLEMLRNLEFEIFFKESKIEIRKPKNEVVKKQITIESDWSAASYYYSLMALSNVGSEIKLRTFFPHSLQGDSMLQEIYKSFGVATQFIEKENVITLSKVANPEKPKHLEFNLINTPDIAQTIAVTCLGMGWKVKLTGLHTLKIKETDRLQALKNELEKLGAKVSISKDTLHLISTPELKPNQSIETYDDHRMAMAFAPLALKTPLHIKNPEVVSKSYPEFWEHWAHLLK
jgi:3-phosphoshikimate 1-carboxyvinyltransferase